MEKIAKWKKPAINLKFKIKILIITFYSQNLASLLGFGCSISKQCTLKVPNSECVDGLCQCKSNFVPLRRDKCLPRKQFI